MYGGNDGLPEVVAVVAAELDVLDDVVELMFGGGSL
jgi:hypothetical protein